MGTTFFNNGRYIRYTKGSKYIWYDSLLGISITYDSIKHLVLIEDNTQVFCAVVGDEPINDCCDYSLMSNNSQCLFSNNNECLEYNH